MTLYPEVQGKARAEIDAFVGRDRLPMYSDHPNLPYIQALLMETLRWKLVTPQGMPSKI
jgi:cytochrome P450